MATKKTAAKKPITTMAKASPIKQAKKPVVKPVVKTTSKPRVDDAEMKAYIKNRGAAKDKDVAAHKQSLLDRDYNPKTGKGGYTDAQVNLYKNILKKGEWSMGGANINFKTGQGGITKFDKMYQKGSNKYMRDRVLTGDGKKEISNSGMEYGNSNGFPSQDYLKKSQAARMGDKQFRIQYVNDSIVTQGEKEKMYNRGQNFARLGSLYGTQTSEIGSKVKATVNKKTSEKVVNTKKADSAKVVVKKKTPLKQTMPTTKKKSVEINPKDGMRRPTPPKSRIGLETTRLNTDKTPKSGSNTIGGRSLEKNGFNPGTKIDGDRSKSGRKYPSKDEVGTGGDSVRRQSIKDKFSSTKRAPVKMKKC